LDSGFRRNDEWEECGAVDDEREDATLDREGLWIASAAARPRNDGSFVT